ncbi:ABC transporter ATP-binding protein [Flavihumibacter solisilvae]|uniref:ABC transporter ATP-binding protein n=1 Tax=Flavihumibacter solisilvae TaxID=1349421 RepID=UPI00068D02B7|nr:ABC transporter ATP-binding protein [Flavihumibacter solisilvae]
MDFLSVSGISKQEGGELVVNQVSFSQEKGQKIAIAGETGSGKSTLLKIVGGLAQPDEGVAMFERKRVLGPLERLIPGQPGIAYLSQHFELRNSYRVEEILFYANQLVPGKAEEIFEICEISHLLKRRTDRLSGGERQRIALARLLVSSPRLLLLDEPYSNLDRQHKETLKSVIADIGEQLDITCILVSHDPQDILSWADEVLIMKSGSIIQRGDPYEIYYRPVSEYAGSLLGRYNILDGGVFVRPEKFNITQKESGPANAVVKRVTFMGALYELDVLFSGNIIEVLTVRNDLKPGDEIFVSLPREETWKVNM